MTQTTQERSYVPQIGARVMLRLFSDYSRFNLPAWTRLHTTGVDGDNIICVQSLTANGEHDGELVTVPVNVIAPPIGWQPRYTIHCAPDKVADVLSWLSRGIAVRQSQYIGDGSTAFQPMDNSGTPHWRFGELTDTISPEDCARLIRVVSVEPVADAFLPAPCRYCDGSGIHTSNESLREQTASTSNCDKCGMHLGFSFTEPWHDNGRNMYGANDGCARSRKAGECWVCNGTGQGARYLSEMEPKKERKAAIAQLESEGWKLWYEKRGRVWFMERETVVKDWANA